MYSVQTEEFSGDLIESAFGGYMLSGSSATLSEDGETSWGQIDDQDLRRGRRQSRRRVRGAGGGGRGPCVCPGAAVAAAAAARGILSFSMRVRTLLFLVALGIPGNLYVLYLYYTVGDEEAPSSPSKATSENVEEWHQPTKASLAEAEAYGERHSAMPDGDDDDAVFSCYEDMSVWSGRIDAARFWIEGVALTTVGFVGFLGNIFCIMAVATSICGNREKNSTRGSLRSTNFYTGRQSFLRLLVVLAAADTFFLAFFMFDLAYIDAFQHTPPEWYNSLYPRFMHPAKYASMSACIFLVIAVAADRYHAICNPMKARPSPRSISVIVFFVSVTTNLPKLFEYEVTKSHNSTMGPDVITTTELNEDPRYIVFNSYFELITTGIVPLAALSFYNFFIYRKIRKSAIMKGRYVGRKFSASRPCGVRYNLGCIEAKQTLFCMRHGGDVPPPTALASHNNVAMAAVCNSQEATLLRSKSLPSLILRATAIASTTIGTTSLPSKSSPTLTVTTTTTTTTKAVYDASAIAAAAAATGEAGQKGLRRGSARLRRAVPFKCRTEKPTAILVGIVIVFVLCHALRFCFLIYHVVHPSSAEHFQYCLGVRGRLPAPVVFFFFGNLSHLLLVVNSSVNGFIYYYCGSSKSRIKSANNGGSLWRRAEASSVPEVTVAATTSRTSRTRLTGGGAVAESSML